MIKKNAAAHVAMKHGISLSAYDSLPSGTNNLARKTSAKESPATMTININMPGIESRYWFKASVRVRPGNWDSK